MYYDAKADAELVSVPTFAVEDREQPEPCLCPPGPQCLSCRVGVYGSVLTFLNSAILPCAWSASHYPQLPRGP